MNRKRMRVRQISRVVATAGAGSIPRSTFRSIGCRAPSSTLESIPIETNSVPPDRTDAGERTGSDAYTQYMRSVTEVALITPQQEIELAARIRKGDAEAREHMIRANLRFVIKIAREYEHLGLPLLDLINEGNMGLMLAVDRFNPEKGAKLSTYSALWIRQSIRRALSRQGKTIRMPGYAADQNYHLLRAEVRLRASLGRDATEEELATDLGLSAERISELRQATLRPASLDAALGDEDSSRLADVVADENAEIPGASMDKESYLNMLNEVLPKLPAREAKILKMRFGLGGEVERTLNEIGALMRLTRERIRQLQNIALSRLRRLMEERDRIVSRA